MFTFGLTVFAQERRIADDAVKRAFQLYWELNRLLEVVPDELFEHCKTLVDFQ